MALTGGADVNHPDSAINRLQTPMRDEFLVKISQRARSLRGTMNDPSAPGTPGLARLGRRDALEGLLVRLGIIPVITAKSATSLNAYVQAEPSKRSGPDQIVVAGPTTPQGFNNGDAMRTTAFAAAGNATVVTATSTADAAAKGRATVDVPA